MYFLVSRPNQFLQISSFSTSPHFRQHFRPDCDLKIIVIIMYSGVVSAWQCLGHTDYEIEFHPISINRHIYIYVVI